MGETDEPGGTPRGARPGDRTRLAVFGVVLLLVSPVAPLVAAGTLMGVAGQVRRGWREFAFVAVPVLLLVVAVVWMVSGNPLAAQYEGLLAAVHGSGSWAAGVAQTMLFGVPLGVAAGVMELGLIQRWAAGADWHWAEVRRKAVLSVKDRNQVAYLARPEVVRKFPVPVLGVFRGGDLSPWRQGAYVVPPRGKFPAMGVVGESGSGKTVSVERLAWLAGKDHCKVIFSDFKGSDPELPERVMAAYLSARGESARCKLWPVQPMDIWRGGATEMSNKLLQVQRFTEPFYEQAAQTAVRLAVNAPGVGPVRNSDEFLARLDKDWLRKVYEAVPGREQDVEAISMPQVMEGVRLRYAGFFSALGSRFDRGWSWEDADLAVISVPTLAEPSDAIAAARVMLADFGAWCLGRKPRDERVVFFVDEFSAVTGAAPMVIDLAERIRDVGGQVVVSAQNTEGLGNNRDERKRMRDALVPGGLIIHRLGDPGEVLQPAGRVEEAEQSWYLDPAEPSGKGTVRMQQTVKVDSDEVRKLETGAAFVITHGRALKMQVLATDIPDATRSRARELIRLARADADDLARLQAEAREHAAQVRAVAAVRSNGHVPAKPARRKPVKAGTTAVLELPFNER